MNEPKPFNFIVARFGDNDFGYSILQALEAFVNEYSYHLKCDPSECARFIRIFVAGKFAVWHASDLALPDHEVQLEFAKRMKYLEGIRVVYDDKAPENEDHDGASAAIDINTKYTWKF